MREENLTGRQEIHAARRAGEQGRGFAVVADEVRNLAQRSAKAAKETAEKIDDAITKSQHGVQVSGKVRARLEVPPGIDEHALRELALAEPNVVRALDGAGVRTVIVRAPNLVNVVPV